MGLFDAFKAKSEEKKEVPQEPSGKYSEACSLCGNPGTEKKWLGQYWHVKCLRQVKKGARKMV